MGFAETGKTYLRGLSYHAVMQSGETYYYFCNSHGDVTGVVNSNKTTVATYDYDEFGNLTSETGDFDNDIKYAGEFFDIESENYYLRSRYYDPTIGRFTQQDTFLGVDDNPLSLNRYTYCHNNPIRFVDPSGHAIQSVTIGGVAINIDPSHISNGSIDDVQNIVNQANNGNMSAVGFYDMMNYLGVPVGVGEVLDTNNPDNAVFAKLQLKNISSAYNDYLNKPIGIDSFISKMALNGIDLSPLYYTYISQSEIDEAGMTYASPIYVVDWFPEKSSISRRSYNNLLIYSGNTGLGGEDLQYGDMTKEELRDLRFISLLSFKNEDKLISKLRGLADSVTGNNKKLNKVANSMIDKFISGEGGTYSNDELTKSVKESQSTQEYMKKFSAQFVKALSSVNGNVYAIANEIDNKDSELRTLLRSNDVMLSKLSYGGGLLDSDGLTFCVHGWIQNDVKVKNLTVDGNNYSGTLEFTFIDNFGLDEVDVEKYGIHGGFGAWYILQHYDAYKGKYVPFQTVVTVEYELEGMLNGGLVNAIL